MLREYEWNGSTWQFEESQAPQGARPVDPAKDEKAAAEPKDKSRAAKNKAASQ